MNVDEKRERLKAFCIKKSNCDGCKLEYYCELEEYNFNSAKEDYINKLYEIVYGTKEEINHPDRYACGQFECIDVMLDVFGADTVKHFCILNAFKYLWRSEKKNGIEDIKKAVWYLNKYIELGCDKMAKKG